MQPLFLKLNLKEFIILKLYTISMSRCSISVVIISIAIKVEWLSLSIVEHFNCTNLYLSTKTLPSDFRTIFHADLISQMNNSQNFTQMVWQSQSIKNIESLIGVLVFSEVKTWKSLIPFSTFSHTFSFFKYFFPDISHTSNFPDANFCDFLRGLYFAKIAKNPRNKTRVEIDPHQVCFSYTRLVA